MRTSTALLASLVGLAACLLGAAPAAMAGTASVGAPQQHKGFLDAPKPGFSAAPGETNHLRVSMSAGPPTTASGVTTKVWQFQDSAAPVTAGTGCAQIDANTATCSLDFGGDPDVYLGDGDDELVANQTVSAYLGDGSDTARVEPLNGHPVPAFYLDGGRGDDLLDASAAAYASVTGGHGTDRLIGSPGGDTLIGEAGNDTIDGGAGNDRIDGYDGADTIACGAGDDHVEVDGRDRLVPPAPTYAPGAEFPSPAAPGLVTDCEELSMNVVTVTFDFAPAAATLSKAGNLMIGTRTSLRHRGDLQLRSTKGTLLAAGPMRTKGDRLSVRLTKAGRRALKPGSSTTVVITTRPKVSKGSTGYGPGFTITLQMPS